MKYKTSGQFEIQNIKITINIILNIDFEKPVHFE